jgi:hypothetical protein
MSKGDRDHVPTERCDLVASLLERPELRGAR